MTGFGKAIVIFNNKKITAEIKSLNSKQLDLSVRLPQAYREIELDLRNEVSRILERGKVELNISVESNEQYEAASINVPLVSAYKAQIEQISAVLEIPLPTDWYSTLLRMPDVLKQDNGHEISEDEMKAMNNAVVSAVKALMDYRTQEGNRLSMVFREKIHNIGTLLTDVEPLEKERVAKIKARIYDALSKLEGIEFDRGRFEQEMIFYIEKLDINEEKQRLRNHLDYFIETMDHAHGQGKKLGFISQEMGREINTLGSKSNNPEMQRIVVRMKDELEQIKEQVLNVM